MTRKAYPTDVNDAEWGIIEPLLPASQGIGRPRSVDLREIINGIFYVLREGCSWRALPHDLPPWQTVYNYFRHWQRAVGSVAKNSHATTTPPSRSPRTDKRPKRWHHR